MVLAELLLETLDARRLAVYLIGGMALDDLPAEYQPPYAALTRPHSGVREYLMPPLPNTRDTTCRLYVGVPRRLLIAVAASGRRARRGGRMRVVVTV